MISSARNLTSLGFENRSGSAALLHESNIRENAPDLSRALASSEAEGRYFAATSSTAGEPLEDFFSAEDAAEGPFEADSTAGEALWISAARALYIR
jgi:hypothetical protein